MEQLLSVLIDLNNLYIARSYEYENSFISFLKNCETFFEQVGNPSNRAKIVQQRAYYETALRGINPYTLEKLKSNKRDNTWTTAFQCLNIIGSVLQDSFEDLMNTLEEGKELLSQIIISAISSKLITEEEITATRKIKDVQLVWGKLLKNTQVKSVEKKLKLSLNQQDIYLLLHQIICRIR
ncbi:MAG: hypothetical protein AAF806_19005 [Bacteroidota bacterium]